MRNLAEPPGTNLKIFKNETFMWNLVEPQLLRMEPSGTSTFNNGTFMWNLVEPQLLTVEPFFGTLWNLNF